MNTKFTIAAILVAASQALASGEVKLKFRYHEADSHRLVRGERSVDVPDTRGPGLVVSDPKIRKTLLVVELAETLKASLKQYEEVCKPTEHFPVRPLPGPRPIPHPVRPPIIIDPVIPFPVGCVEQRQKIAENLLLSVTKLSREANGFEFIRLDRNLVEVFDLVRKLAKNMKESKEMVGGLDFHGGGIRALAAGTVSAGLNITSGGAQDFGYFRKVVNDGYVPFSETLTSDGFMKEFDLSLDMPVCRNLICVEPAIARKENKLFVQIAMNSSITKESFQRKPLNLSIVLDISGSMSATDNTEKNRLEWAKDAIERTLGELTERDILSIVLFDTTSEVLLKPTRVSDKESILAMVKKLQPRGSTNMEAGLRDGYQLVSQNTPEVAGYENRVILVSDAGLNTGATDESTLLKLVTDYANEGIGLSAIGLGLNFNQKFIHGITMSRGGNYLFVHSGSDMLRYFQAFNFLVTPVAVNFKANLEVVGLSGKLVKTHGIPAKEGENVHTIIDIQTLFFSEEGGAILVEYALN